MVCALDNNPELFAATIGGLGITGLIEWVELQLMPIKSSMMETTSIRFASLSEFFALSEEFDRTHEYTVAWVDCLAKEPFVGRGVFMAGKHAHSGSLKVSLKRKLSVPVPVTPPISAINKLTLRLFNFVYYHMHKVKRQYKVTAYEPFFYPLDGILHWNRIYGPKGFQQYQCVIPEPSAEEVMEELLAIIAASGNGSFLAVMKRCGSIVSPGLLSFPVPGVTLALDFPQHGRQNNKLFLRLDSIVRQANGRLYPAKDAHMSGKDFRHFYPNWEQLEALRDPVLCSRFWNRVIQS